MKNKFYITKLLDRKYLLHLMAVITLSIFSATLTYGQTVTLVCTGTSGSFNSGSVNAAGTKNDGNMVTINSGANRGWATFSLASIPSGAIINSATLEFTTFTSTSSSAVNSLTGFLGNPSALAGATLFSTIGSGTVMNSSSWAANLLNSKVVTAGGLTFIGTNAGSSINIGYVRASTNTYNIFGYPGTSVQQPKLIVNYTVPSPCTGTPAPGNTVASAASVCNGTAVNLSLQNATAGLGVTYAWQHSDNNISWTPFGTSSPTASFTMGVIPKYFRCLVTCSGNTGISNFVLVNNSAFLSCYCATSYSSCSGDGILNVSLNTLANPSGGCPGAGNYTYFNPGVAGTSLLAGSSYTLSVLVQSDPNQFTNAWIDFNLNGVLEAGEALGATVNPGGNGTAVFNFTVPPVVVGGITRLRVRGGVDGTFTTSQACGANIGSTFGEIEDYDVQIIPLTPCMDPPTAGTANSNITQFCNTATVNLNLSLTGNSIGVGQTYQWEYSSDNLTYFPIGGATTAAYTYNGVTVSYYYRCQVTCGASTVPSASVFVEAVAPPTAGVISGPASGFVNIVNTYSSVGAAGSLQWIARLQPSTTWLLVPGGVSNPQNIFFGNQGTWEIRLVSTVTGCTDSSNIVSTVIILPGDNVCDAIPVVIGVNGPFSNVGATIQPGEAQAPNTNCNSNMAWCIGASGLISNTVWFSFTVPSGGSGRYGLGFSPNNWDSQVAIWSATACGDLTSGLGTLIAANDDSLSSPFQAFARAHCLNPGQTYYIQVDGFGGTTNSAFGLRITDLGPANPSFAVLPAQVCENGASITLVPAVAGGTFSGPGVVGANFDPSLAGSGVHSITYTLSGLDICYSSSQSIQVDEPTFVYYPDVDNDSYGDGDGITVSTCSAVAPSGYVVDATDCNDGDGSINPGATEICNLIDDNCDFVIDEGFDVDNDGFTSCGGDCNDNDNTVYPGAAEVCNGVDDDCNLLVDDGLTFITYYADVDGDTYGDASSAVSTCNGAPVGYVSNSSDCNDNNAAVNPAATEICNTIDDDCDGLIDENVLVAGPISGPSVQCMAVVTGSATFSISPVFDATGYSWTVPNGMIIVSGQGTTSIFVSWAPQAVSNGIIGNITVTPSNSCGAGVSSSLGADINAVVPVRPSSISGPTKLCPGDNGVYSVAPVARASNYIWTIPTGMSILSGAGTNVITVDVNGAYLGGTVSCRAANACGMGPNRDRSVTVNVPVASASISGPSTGVCGSTGVAYSAAAVASATGYNWSVPVGATIVSGQGTQSIVVDFDGAYAGGNVSVNATNACGVGAARNLNVTGAPGLPGVITGDITICPGQSGVAYGVSTVTGASSYLWSLPGGTTITSGQGTKDILATWGTNPASGLNLSVNASNGCGTSANRVLNGISISIAHCGPRFGDQGEITGLNVYPNPAADRATVVFTSTEGADFNIKMVDVSGRTIMTERGTATNGLNQREVNVSEMSAGIYFVVIETNNVVEQIKMIVE